MAKKDYIDDNGIQFEPKERCKMEAVEIYETQDDDIVVQKVCCTLYLEDDKITLSQDFPEALLEEMTEHGYMLRNGEILRLSDGERFFDNLYRFISGSYLRASRPIDIEL